MSTCEFRLFRLCSLLALAALGCGGGEPTSTSPDGSVGNVKVAPPAATLAIGDHLVAAATVLDMRGSALPGATVSWSSSDTTIATISNAGDITARGVGTAIITASSGGQQGRLDLSVSAADIGSITVGPDSFDIAVGGTQDLQAVVHSSSGAPLPDQTVSWSTSDPAIATISVTGRVTAVAPGNVTFTASAGGKQGKVKGKVVAPQVGGVSVTPATVNLTAGGTQQLSATASDLGGNPVTCQSLTWSSGATGVATVSASGLVTGVAAGTATITATCDGATGTATVNVGGAGEPVPSVTPTTATVAVGQAASLTAELRDPSGNPISGVTWTWTTTNGTIATVAASAGAGVGVVTGRAAGITTVTATGQGKSASATITVTPPPVASVSMSPTSLSLAVGQSGNLTATAKDAAGNPIPGATIAWTTSTPSVATVASNGRVTALAAGSATITATSGGKSATAAVTVTPAAVASVTVTPSPSGVTMGQTLQLTATARDAGGAAIPSAVITWSTGSGAIATVSTSGLVLGVAAGSTTITASSGGQSGTSALTVNPPTVTSITLSPTSAALTVGQTGQFTATPEDAGGNPVSGATVLWSTGSTGIATVSSSGLVTAVAAGNTQVTASVGTATQSASVTVSGSSGGTHAGWYVAPNGTSGGAGTSASPWDLTSVLNGQKPVQAGDTVWLRGGTYTGVFTSRLTGSAGAPIIVRQYPGERATIRGSMTVNGAYTWYWGFEVANPSASTFNVMGISSFAPGARFINLVLHDHSGNGIGVWTEGPDQEVYGTLIYYNGFNTPTNFGHGIYVQNQNGTKLLRDNIIFDQFGYNVHGYASDQGYLRNITIDGNILFNSGMASGGTNILIGGGAVAQSIAVTNNYTWNGPVWVGYSSTQSRDVTIQNNYLADSWPALRVYNWDQVSSSGNTVIGLGQSGSTLQQMGPATGYSWNGNTYYGNRNQVEFGWQGGGYTFDGWRQVSGLGGSDNYAGAAPTGLKVVVRPNQYESGRANIVVYNWSSQGSVAVDLSNVLHTGDRYEVRNVQNFYGAPAAGGTYSGGSVTLPLSAVAPLAPLGGSVTPPSTGTTFHAFVVLLQ